MGILGAIIGYSTAFLGVFLIDKIGFSLFIRTGLDKEAKYYLGDVTWNRIQIDDLFIVSYSYNEREPRFYSKYFIKNDPGTYNVDIKTAVESSSSAPFYFPPNKYTNGFNIEETLIDGGLIANDPSLFAY